MYACLSVFDGSWRGFLRNCYASPHFWWSTQALCARQNTLISTWDFTCSISYARWKINALISAKTLDVIALIPSDIIVS